MKRVETYTWKVVRIVLGLPLLAIVPIGMALARGIVNGVDLNALRVVTFVGAFLFVSGVVGIIRLRRDRRAEPPPKRSFGRKAAWFLAATVIALVVTAGTVFTARVLNVVSVERDRWEDPWALPDEGQAGKPKSYLNFAASHHPGIARELLDEAERAQDARAPGLRALENSRSSSSSSARSPHATTIGEYQGWIDYLRRLARSPGGDEVSWYLDTFTPVREHLETAKIEYDDARFQDSVAEGSSTALRIYLYELPDGRHADDARQALRDLYRTAEARYAELIEGRKTEAASVAGIRALLAHLREREVDHFMVPVCFLPVEGLEGDAIEQAIRTSTGAKKIVPVSPAFTAEQNEARHAAVVRRMDEALRAVVGDLFRLEEGEVGETRDRARFLVNYRVFGTGNVYSRTTDKELPLAARTLYVGVALEFECSIQTPTGDAPLADDPAAGHRFALVAEPAPNFRAGRSDMTPEENAAAVYGAMAGTAFDDFRRSLVESYGLGKSAEEEGGE